MGARRSVPRRPLAVFALLCLVSAGCRSEESFTAVGEVVGVNPAKRTVTLRHEPIPGLLRASTSVFQLADPELSRTAVMGDRVRFELRRSAPKTLRVTQLEPITKERRGVHDHTPHHGGVVVMHGMSHFEAVALPDGILRVYLTDRWRRPIAPDTANGTVTLNAGGERVSLPLEPRDGALEAKVERFGEREVQAEFRIVREGETFEMSFLLPVARDGRGAVGIPLSGCAPAGKGAPPELRCVLSFPRPITAISAAPGGDVAFIAAVDLGVTVWNLDDGSFVRGFEAPPAVRGRADEPPHVESINALALQSGGGRLALALENRALLYDTRNGRFQSGFTGTGIVRDLRWIPDDQGLLIASFYSPEARLVEAQDGLVRRRFSVPAEASAIAVSRDGTELAVGTSKGQVVVFSGQNGAALSTFDVAPRTIRDLLFLGHGVLAAAAADGTVHLIDLAGGSSTRSIEVGTTVYRLAPSPTGEGFASSGMDGVIRLHRADGSVVTRFAWRRRQTFALAWPRPELLISGDVDGQVVFWRIENESMAGQ